MESFFEEGVPNKRLSVKASKSPERLLRDVASDIWAAASRSSSSTVRNQTNGQKELKKVARHWCVVPDPENRMLR